MKTIYDSTQKKFLTLFNGPPEIVPPTPPAQTYSAAQVAEQLANARKEEKDKLYRDKERLSDKLKEQEAKALAAEAELQKLKAQSLPSGEQVNQQLAALNKKLDEESAARRNAEAVAAAERLERLRLTKIQEAGPAIIPDLVVGSTPEMIDMSVQIAKAEYSRVSQEVFQQIAAQGFQIVKAAPVTAPPVTPVTPSPFQTTQPAGGFPQVVNGQPPPAQPQQGLTPEQVTYLTSEESIRNGTFAKYRNQLYGHLRGGAAPASLPPVAPVQLPLPQSFAGLPTQSLPQTIPVSPAPPQAPVQQPGNPQLPPNAVQNLSSAELQNLQQQIINRGPKTPDAAKAFDRRFNPVHNQPE